jgi:hypothetical protein
MNRKQLNLVLGVVALALLATVFLTRKKPEDGAGGGAALTSLTREAITKITLSHPGTPDIVLEKTASQWNLIAPVKAAADRFQVDSLLAFANAETRSKLDSAGLDRTELGLDPPKYTVALNDTVLSFGEIEPLKYSRYVEVKDAAGDRIVTVDDSAGASTDADYSDLVSRSLLPDEAQIASIEVPGLSVMKAAAGPGWTSVPADAAQNSDAIQKFVDHWRDAKSLFNQAPPKDEAAKPGVKPEAAVVTLQDGTQLSFHVIARAPQLVIERADIGVRYTLAAPEADALLALPKDKAPADAKPAAAPPAPAK